MVHMVLCRTAAVLYCISRALFTKAHAVGVPVLVVVVFRAPITSTPNACRSPPYHVADMRNAASGNPTSPVVSAERDHGAGQGGGRGNGGRQEEEEIVDLATCTPKTGGRSFVWKAELFVLDPLKRPVCTCCGIKVAAGNGNTQSNTTNLICHYESRRADKGHAEKLEHARKEYEAKGKGPATPRSHKKAAK